MSTPFLQAKPSLGVDNLESLMQRRLGSRIRNLTIVVQAGGIILRGRTTTYHVKQLALHAVLELTDLPILANDIEVY